MMHHPLFPHISGADLFISTYSVDDYETVRNRLADAGIKVILTGHFHVTDNAMDWNADKTKEIYDLNGHKIELQITNYELPKLPRGVYIVKSKNKTCKIVVK